MCHQRGPDKFITNFNMWQLRVRTVSVRKSEECHRGLRQNAVVKYFFCEQVPAAFLNGHIEVEKNTKLAITL